MDVITRASEITRICTVLLSFCRSLTNCKATCCQRQEIEFRYTKFLARLSNEQKVRSSALPLCWVLRAKLESFRAGKDQLYEFFLLLRQNILFWKRKWYHHWNPFQKHTNSYHGYNKRLLCLVLRLSLLFSVVILRTAALFYHFHEWLTKWAHT